MTDSIIVSWEVWSDGEKRFQAWKNENKSEPKYVTIDGNKIQLDAWKDSQQRVIKFKKDNKKNPLTVKLTLHGAPKDIITPPKINRDKETGGYYYCSCGEKGYGYGRWKVTFINKCAFADDASHKHKSSKLKWSDKKDVAPLEGQWTCEGCDADYCAVTGKEKISGSTRRLTKVSEEKMPKNP